MEKSKFERFISKYNLAGACESVLYTVDNSTISTRGISEDKNVVCEVSSPNMGFSVGEYPVYETSKLRSLLNVLTDSLSVGVKTSRDIPVGLTFADSNTEVVFVLSDKNVIPVTPTVTKIPKFDIVIKMDEQFISTFVKAKGALNDVETFTVMSNGETTTADVIIGYSNTNTNRVKIVATTNAEVALEPINFSAKYLRDILVANKDAKSGELHISSKGIAKTSFAVDGIVSTYFLVQIKA
jgi:hypothetical protein